MEIYGNISHMNYRGLGLEDVNGKQGGAFNAHWKVWQPNLGLGSMMGLGYSQLGYLTFSPAQYGECDIHGNDRYVIALCF